MRSNLFSSFLLGFSLLLSPLLGLADPQGWLWYNEVAAPKPEDTVPLKTLSPKDQVLILNHYTMNALNAATLNPTDQNMTDAILWQNLWMEKAWQFSDRWRETLLYHPELDYTVKHPTANYYKGIELQEREGQEQAAINELSKEYGLFFFYRGAERMDQETAKTVARFSERFKVEVIAVSVDGVVIENMPNSVLDDGQAQNLHIETFPAILLVHPKTEEVKPLHFGFVTDDVLKERFLLVLHHYQGEASW
jgi:conjugal transfer pilus assembly protein TraF